MRSPRRLFALCSPRTHVIASTTLLLPQPFGPTMAVTPVSKASSDRSGKLLKPAISSRLRRICPTRRKPLPGRVGGRRPGSGWVRFGGGAVRIRLHRLSGYEDWTTTVWFRHPNIPHTAGWPLGPGNGGQSNNAPYLG